MTGAEIVLLFIAAYASIGFVFAVAFAIRGAASIDSAARGTPLGFRLLLTPGATAFWPWLGMRWLRPFLAGRSA